MNSYRRRCKPAWDWGTVAMQGRTMLTWQPARLLLRLRLPSATIAAASAPIGHCAVWAAAAACRRTAHSCHAGLELLQQGDLPLSLMLCCHRAAAEEGQRGRQLRSQCSGRRSPQLLSWRSVIWGGRAVAAAQRKR